MVVVIFVNALSSVRFYAKANSAEEIIIVFSFCIFCCTCIVCVSEIQLASHNERNTIWEFKRQINIKKYNKTNINSKRLCRVFIVLFWTLFVFLF